MVSSSPGAGGALPAVRPRPPLFRALGTSDPPEQIQIGGEPYAREAIFKHDSWAATALYDGPRGKVVCKFNRRQRIGFIPMLWLGKALASREAAILRRLSDLPNVPRWSGEVSVADKRQANAVAHAFIPGRPLHWDEKPNDRFFPELAKTLDEMHLRGVAYVDLHKRENVIVGEDGEPYLVDFQIAFALSRRWPGNAWPMRVLLRMLQESDRHHLRKMIVCAEAPGSAAWRSVTPPWWIRAHRLVAVPFRTFRRWLLVKLRIRAPGGSAASERFVEVGLRSRRRAT